MTRIRSNGGGGSGGGGGTTAVVTPTTMQENLTIVAHSQMLFRQHIIVGSKSIILETDASLIGV